MANIYDECHAAGGMTSYNWVVDPKRLAFQYSRYKFVAKMLEHKRNVLEVGCADGQGARIVKQHVGRLTAVDSDTNAIEDAKRLGSKVWPIEFRVADIMAGDLDAERFEAVYCLDLFEHVREERLLLVKLRRIAEVCIIGTPSLESQRYASQISLAGHVNCVSGERLRATCLSHWQHVFMFGMNDEVVHTGYLPMAHYLFAVCVR